jgi:hypothetical protein
MVSKNHRFLFRDDYLFVLVGWAHTVITAIALTQLIFCSASVHRGGGIHSLE